MPARRLRYKQTLLPNDVNAPDTPSNEERARSRSRSPHGLQAAPSPPGAAAAHRDSVTSRSSDGQAANGRSTTTRLSGSFRQSKTRVSRMRTSFAHRDFDNPYAETCWLSCLFQTLWHSVVFHRAFDEHLAVGKYRPSPAENILTALQRTWADYEFAEAQDQHVSSSEPAAPEFVDDAAIPGLGRRFWRRVWRHVRSHGVCPAGALQVSERRCHANRGTPFDYTYLHGKPGAR